MSRNLSGHLLAATVYIFDYLMEEILSRQEQDVQEFLLKTSILERMSAPLCDAMLGQTNSQLILDRLEKTNLFLVSMDDERTWYRYHLLFADLLYSSLKQSHGQRLFLSFTGEPAPGLKRMAF